MKTKSDFQFNYSLFMNDKIICQRLFSDYNYKKNHINFDEVVEIINVTTNLIKEFIKSESIDLLWKNYDAYNRKSVFCTESKKDLLKIEIRYCSKLIASSCIEANIYHPKIKYKIDIRSIIPDIVASIRLCLL